VAEDDPDAADRLLASFDRKLYEILDHPGLGRPREELGRGFRSVPVGHYLLFYRQRGDDIELLRVIHGQRDLPSVFSQRRD
jgi:toxin ParE1/3/4